MSDTATADAGAAAVTTTAAADTVADTGQVIDTKQGGATDSGNANPFASLLNADGSFVDGWPNLLEGDEYGEVRATAGNYKTLRALLKGLKDSKAAAMAKADGMVKLPGDGSTPEEIAAYRRAVGVPESPDDYAIPAELVPPDMAIDATVFAEFKGVAHAAGLTGSQVQALAKWQLDMEATRATQARMEEETAMKAEAAALQAEWGPQYQAKMALARRAAETFGFDVEGDPLLQRASSIRSLAAIAAAISEDKLITADAVTNRLTPSSQADDILKNPANRYHKAFNNKSDPGHAEAVRVWQDLMLKANPG